MAVRTEGSAGKFVTKARGHLSPDSAKGVDLGIQETAAGPRQRVTRSARTHGNVSRLIAGFADYVDVFEHSAAFPGPSLYFHQRALARRRELSQLQALLADELFFEYVYAVLPAWGMHRMGKQRAKVGEFGPFIASFRSVARSLEDLWPLKITEVGTDDAPAVADAIWEVLASLEVSTSATRIVAGSKALHHVLPDLVPPIDRQYTFRFFTGQKSVARGDRQAFLEWYPYFCEIARARAAEIESIVGRGGFMATGPAKVIDNAIMGFMQGRGDQGDAPGD